jgi:serine/threonine protein kinase
MGKTKKGKTKKGKTKKTRYINNKGGEVIASGGFGCVFNPALKCEGSSERESGKISKLMTEKHATQEYEEISKIKSKLDTIKNYEDYFLVYDSTLCRPAKLTSSDLTAFGDKCKALPKNNITKANINSKLNEVMSLNLPNGGLTVDDYMYANEGYDKLYKIHMALVNLLKNGIVPMNRKNIYHNDIKDSNILLDDSDGSLKVRLIDWGSAVEYVPQKIAAPFPENLRNMPLQFNLPFSVIIFTDLFYEKYSKYLEYGGRIKEGELKPFIINYLDEWIEERGYGHYNFINEIMFLLLYNNTIASKSDNDNKLSLVKDFIRFEFTAPLIIDYLVDVLLHYTKFKEDGSLNLSEYLNEVYIKILDIWGFITAYYPMLKMLSINYFTLNKNELKIFRKIQNIFKKYLYSLRHEPINMDELFKDLNKLGCLIYIEAYHKTDINDKIEDSDDEMEDSDDEMEDSDDEMEDIEIVESMGGVRRGHSRSGRKERKTRRHRKSRRHRRH